MTKYQENDKRKLIEMLETLYISNKQFLYIPLSEKMIHFRCIIFDFQEDNYSYYVARGALMLFKYVKDNIKLTYTNLTLITHLFHNEQLKWLLDPILKMSIPLTKEEEQEINIKYNFYDLN